MESHKVVAVRIAVRSRPLVSKELIAGCQVGARKFPNSESVGLGGDETFTYDCVFGEESRQVEVYDACVSKLLPKVFEGFNIAILAYGQTGSGKTFTMGSSCSSNGARSEDAGIIPRAVKDIFRHISTNTEKIFLICNLTELIVTIPDETIRPLAVGSASRSTASTNMNMRCSQSHAILTLIIEQQAKSSGGAVTVAKFHLVDLAGSEADGKAEIVAERLKEALQMSYCLQVPEIMPLGTLRLFKKIKELLVPLSLQGEVFSGTAL